jgi:hypothetical protein
MGDSGTIHPQVRPTVKTVPFVVFDGKGGSALYLSQVWDGAYGAETFSGPLLRRVPEKRILLI